MKRINRLDVEYVVSRVFRHLHTIGRLKKADEITEANIYDLSVRIWKELNLMGKK